MMQYVADNETKFNTLIKDQFAYGGKKYASTKTKEATDILFDRHSFRWLVGTIDKYTFRYTNLARERDLLKVGCYMYILWLKRGFHLKSTGVKNAVNTTVEVKDKAFSKFVDKFSKKYSNAEHTYDKPIKFISTVMSYWSKSTWLKISESSILEVYYVCYLEWCKQFSKNAGKDSDTWNENKK